jgi:(S)-2-hydroxyglutarate dehydrogenase
MYDFAIIGGGIVGLSTGMALGKRYPNARIVVLEKESNWAFHQTGNNSGVIHSGVYYKPGSFKAKFCRDGATSMVEFCQEHNIAHEVCGKVIVATDETEIPRLDNLYNRGLENGIEVKRITAEEVKEVEPHVRCVAGIRVLQVLLITSKFVLNTPNSSETKVEIYVLTPKFCGLCKVAAIRYSKPITAHLKPDL